LFSEAVRSVLWHDRSVPGSGLVELARDVDARCRLRGQFTLRSGQVSSEYFDKYLLESDPVLLRRVTDQMSTLLPPDTHALGGLELGGVPLAVMLSQATGIPALFVRKQAKNYGTCRIAEGGDPAGLMVALVEDVITTSGAVIQAARALRDLGAIVSTVVCVIDRSQPGSAGLAAAGIAVRSILNKDLLDSLTTPT
jgi:orotate phosphoribosyltransferase